MKKLKLKEFEQWIDQTCDKSNAGDKKARATANALVYFFREVVKISTDESVDAMHGFGLIAELYSHPKIRPIDDTTDAPKKKLTSCTQHITEKEKLPYLSWHAKAEKGGKQQRCGECNRWFFDWERKD